MRNRELTAVLFILGLFLSCQLTRDNPLDPQNPDYRALQPPQEITAQLQGDSTVLLRWQDSNAQEDGYGVERSGDSLHFSRVFLGGADADSFYDTALAGGTIYYYRLFSYIAGVDTVYSDTVITIKTIRPLAPAAIMPPYNLQAVAVSLSSIRLQWEDTNQAATGIVLQRGRDIVSFLEIFRGSAPDGTFLDTGLDTNTMYYYRIYAYETGEDSLYGPAAAAAKTWGTFDLPINGGAINLLAYAVPAAAIRLVWEDSAENEAGYIIQRSSGDTNFLAIDTTVRNGNTYLDTSLGAAGTYHYRLAAFNNRGLGAFSDTVAATSGQVAPFSPESLTLALWHMDDTSAGQMADASPSGLDGTLHQVLLTAGKYAGGYFFSGESSEVTVAGLTMPDTAFRVDFYFKPAEYLDAASPALGILQMENGPLNVYYQAGRLCVQFINTADTTRLSSQREFAANEWVLVSLAENQSSKKIFINGAEAAAVTENRTWPGGPVVLRLGRALMASAPVYFSGRLDEMRIQGETGF